MHVPKRRTLFARLDLENDQLSRRCWIDSCLINFSVNNTDSFPKVKNKTHGIGRRGATNPAESDGTEHWVLTQCAGKANDEPINRTNKSNGRDGTKGAKMLKSAKCKRRTKIFQNLFFNVCYIFWPFSFFSFKNSQIPLSSSTILLVHLLLFRAVLRPILHGQQ